jgi:hypothetical protein
MLHWTEHRRLITMPLLKIELIWKKKWSVTKCLYLLSRYLPCLDTAVIVICKSKQPLFEMF